MLLCNEYKLFLNGGSNFLNSIRIQMNGIRAQRGSGVHCLPWQFVTLAGVVFVCWPFLFFMCNSFTLLINFPLFLSPLLFMPFCFF